MSFAARLRARGERTGSAICLGLDPRPAGIPASLRPSEDTPQGWAEAFRRWGERILELAGDRVGAVKPQIAFFEILGPAGFEAYVELCRFARQRSIPVVADVKRGDIGSTAEAYAEMWLGRGCGEVIADSCTVHPYLGSDGIRPFLEVARREGGGIFVLVRTSNPSAKELQDLEIDGLSLHERVAGLVSSLHEDGEEYGPVGAVVGATWPKELARLRALLPHSWLLVPGYGAQGGGAEDVRAAFDAEGGGALIAASRSLCQPWGKGDAPADWESRILAAVDEMNRDLATVRGGGAHG